MDSMSDLDRQARRLSPHVYGRSPSFYWLMIHQWPLCPTDLPGLHDDERVAVWYGSNEWHGNWKMGQRSVMRFPRTV